MSRTIAPLPPAARTPYYRKALELLAELHALLPPPAAHGVPGSREFDREWVRFELRLFLEEAAGVSKYKERRRETENRLKDTRENLTRVEDILRELNANLDKLEHQAEVATRYRGLQEQGTLKLHQLWFLKHRDAATEEERVKLAMLEAEK